MVNNMDMTKVTRISCLISWILVNAMANMKVNVMFIATLWWWLQKKNKCHE